MPGNVASMPYLTAPCVLPGMSICGTLWPINVYSSNDLSLIAFISSALRVFNAPPRATILPKEIDLPDTLSMIWESRAEHLSALAPSSLAPASMSAIRPAAPARDIASKFM